MVTNKSMDCTIKKSPRTRHSRRGPGAGLAWITLAAWLGVAALNGAEFSMSEARIALEKWVETRQVMAKTKAQWRADRETLENTLSLFGKELETLEGKMASVDTNATQALVEQRQLEAQKAVLDEALTLAATVLTELEEKIKVLQPQLPPPLLDTLDASLKRMPENPADTKMSVNERMRIVLGILNEVEKFNSSVTVSTEVQKNPAGAEIQVRTLYLGLGQAYFVDQRGEYAGIGVPTPQGWRWTPRDKLGPVLNQAIAVYENALPAAFVGLPVDIQ